jgi:hypothetical protein
VAEPPAVGQLFEKKGINMKNNIIFIVGIVIYFGTLIIIQIYLGYRIYVYRKKKRKENILPDNPNMMPKESFIFGMVHVILQLFIIVWSIYFMINKSFSLVIGVGLIILAIMIIRKPFQLIRNYWPRYPESIIEIKVLNQGEMTITPETILNILKEDSVRKAIKTDMERINQIRFKEQWRLGLITPSMDKYDLSFSQLSLAERLNRGFNTNTMINMEEKVPITRAAILYSTNWFNIKYNNILIIHGTTIPFISTYPGWSYFLKTKKSKDEYLNIRDIEINTERYSAKNRSKSLNRFLQEDGFPLKETYVDGDPFTTERGGIVIIEKGKLKIIHKEYFVQSRLIDDEGNLIYLGLDEDFNPSSTWNGFSMKPAMSKYLYKCVEYNEYIPIVRYRSFPFISSIMLPIIDTPMSDSGWADLFINRLEQGQLYIAKEKTQKEWIEMMDKLRQLFFETITNRGYHLLGLTKDRLHLQDYMMKKQRILYDYFQIIDWSLT